MTKFDRETELAVLEFVKQKLEACVSFIAKDDHENAHRAAGTAIMFLTQLCGAYQQHIKQLEKRLGEDG
jgi:hypothetical protein